MGTIAATSTGVTFAIFFNGIHSTRNKYKSTDTYTSSVTDYQKQQITPISAVWCSEQMKGNDLNILFVDLYNENLLNPNHNKMPIYIPTLKNSLSIGHFITVSTANGQTFVWQLIGRSNNVSNPEHLNHFVNIRCFLPLFSLFAQRHINNPTLFPRWSIPCLDVVELVDISRSARVNAASITDIAFIFLENDINN